MSTAASVFQGSEAVDQGSGATEDGSDITEHRGSDSRLSLLIIGFVALSVAWLGDPRAASFSDAGGRLATVKTMADEGRWVPDIGYWAASVDAEGLHHPILFTTPHGARLGRGDERSARRRGVAPSGARWRSGSRAPSRAERRAGRVRSPPTVAVGVGRRRVARVVVRRAAVPVLFYGADFWEHAPGSRSA